MAMDFISGPTSATTTVTPRTSDSDTDTPPHPPPAKRAHHHHHHSYNIHHDNINNNNNENVQQQQQQHVSYKECLKNHAASIGGHALDGCCEFMPGPTANAVDPTSLTCAACGCHRNFHRRDPDDPTPLHHLIPPSSAVRRPHSPPSASQLLLSLSGHTHSPSDHEMVHNSTASAGVGVVTGFYSDNGGSGGGGQNGNFQSKKRFRTKFSQEQKEKMYEFSEKIGWRLKKGEERLVQEFCKEVGVDRSVFKVWMHNNKHSGSASGATAGVGGAAGIVSASALALPSSSSASPQRRDKSGITIAETTVTSSSNGNHGNANISSNNNNNTNNNSNVGLNCGGVLGSSLEFNFANCGGQEAKAQ
ncbi:zinc-finger homeodomain protein 8-like [Chenopodium quinoa]|uniref:zinc-finger homeodomain protein 8-like n=1 Tax=Chenopodium quinoa TaxID=63459 RepID=UPI000B76DD25|nr:zinc-finger homeodomain protein 8-like [Chenopodium quinoa]